MHLQTKMSDFYSIIGGRGRPRKSFIVEALFYSVHHSVFEGFLLSVQITVLKGSAEF